MKVKFKQVFVLCLVIIVPSISFAENPRVGHQIKVGVVLPLSGPVGFQGNSLQKALALAKDTFDLEDRLKFVIEDDGFRAVNTVSAVRKLTSEDKVELLIIFGANQANAVADITEAARIPLISLTVLETLVTNRKYLSVFLPSTNTLMKRTAEQIRIRGYSDIAIVSTQQDACVLQARHLRESGVANVVLSEEVLPGELDMRSIAGKIQRLKPSAVVISMIPPQGSTFARQLREIGYRGQLITTLQVASLPELEASNGALVDAWGVSGDKQSADEFHKTFQMRFGEDATAESRYAYDLVPVILAAVKAGDVNTFMHSSRTFRGASGNFALQPNGVTEFPVSAEVFMKDRIEAIKRD